MRNVFGIDDYLSISSAVIDWKPLKHEEICAALVSRRWIQNPPCFNFGYSGISGMRLRLKTIEPLLRLLENQSSVLWIRKPKKVWMMRELLCQPSYLSTKPSPPSNYGKCKRRRKTFDWNIWIIGMLAFLKLALEGQWMPLYHRVPRLLPLLMVETSKRYLPLLEVLPISIDSNALYTTIWNGLDYVALVVPTGLFVDPILDKPQVRRNFYNKLDKSNYEFCEEFAYSLH